MERVYVQFGVRLRQARKTANLTQDTLAECVGLSRTSITNIERGRQHVSLHMLYQLAAAVHCSVIDLLPDEPKDTDLDIANLLKKSGLGRKGQKWLRTVVTSGTNIEEVGDETD